MKMYSHKFAVAFAEKVRDEGLQNLSREITRFESKFYRTLPMDFNYGLLVQAICETFAITEEEYYSELRYGQLGIARQAACYVLSLYNIGSGEIAQLTGYSQSRVIGAIKRIRNKASQDTFVKIGIICEKLGI